GIREVDHPGRPRRDRRRVRVVADERMLWPSLRSVLRLIIPTLILLMFQCLQELRRATSYLFLSSAPTPLLRFSNKDGPRLALNHQALVLALVRCATGRSGGLPLLPNRLPTISHKASLHRYSRGL